MSVVIGLFGTNILIVFGVIIFYLQIKRRNILTNVLAEYILKIVPIIRINMFKTNQRVIHNFDKLKGVVEEANQSSIVVVWQNGEESYMDPTEAEKIIRKTESQLKMEQVKI